MAKIEFSGTVVSDFSGIQQPEANPGFRRFRFRLDYLWGARATDAQRVACACGIIRRLIGHLLVDDVACQALAAAEAYYEGRVTRKDLSQLRKKAWQLHDQHDPAKGGTSLKVAQVANACHSVTLVPFTGSSLDDVAGIVADALVREAIEQTPDLSVDEQFKKRDEILAQIAEIIPGFIEPRLQLVVERIQSEDKDDFQDRRFLHRWITFRDSREWLSVFVEDESARETGFAALDAFGACQDKRQVGPATVQPIFEALGSSHRRVRDMAAEMILLLATQFEPARNVILETLSKPNEDVRFTIISNFQYYRMPFSAEFVRQVFESCLKDKSARIRTMAVQGCNTYMCRDLLPDLERMLHTEKSSKVLDSVKYHLPLIREEYSIDRTPEGVWLRVLTKLGTTTQKVSEDDLRPENLNRVLQRIREKDEPLSPEK